MSKYQAKKGERWRRCRHCGKTRIIHQRQDLGHRFESDDQGISRRSTGPTVRQPTAEEYLAKPGTVLRRYGG
jgi:hypothetical protein